MVLEFGKLEYHKSGISLISSETVLFCYKFLKMVVFGHFHREILVVYCFGGFFDLSLSYQNEIK